MKMIDIDTHDEGRAVVAGVVVGVLFGAGLLAALFVSTKQVEANLNSVKQKEFTACVVQEHGSQRRAGEKLDMIQAMSNCKVALNQPINW